LATSLRRARVLCNYRKNSVNEVGQKKQGKTLYTEKKA
jgi:hypothetical protein